MATIPSIPEFYTGRKIFVTGGTGFMGKVLIEKLLRSCPDLHTIYILIRPKKEKQPQDRILDVTRQALFDNVRRDNPGAFDKLRAISGDVMELGLGLSDDDKEMLHREVSVVFHAAASVRFTDNINNSVLMNVRGTREVVNLALGMENLQVFVHVSTAYSNVCDRGHVVEELYPPPHGWDWKTAIKLAETQGTDDFVNCLTPKILGPLLPNSYVFAKSLAEQIVNDHRDRLPFVIVRPSIVLGAFDPPIKGWIDNLNGPYGLWAVVYTGILRTPYCNPSLVGNFVPVDLAAKSMIVMSWHRAISSVSNDSKLPIYNCTTMIESMNQGDFHEDLKVLALANPTTHMIWYPEAIPTSNWTCFYVNFILFHLPYGIVLDAILKYKNHKPMFVKTYRRLYRTVVETYNFANISYTFDNTEFLRLADNMLVSDRKEFGYTEVKKRGTETFSSIVFGVRKHLVHDPIETMPEARRKIARLYWLDRVVKGTTYLALFWALTTTNAFRQITALLSP